MLKFDLMLKLERGQLFGAHLKWFIMRWFILTHVHENLKTTSFTKKSKVAQLRQMLHVLILFRWWLEFPGSDRQWVREYLQSGIADFLSHNVLARLLVHTVLYSGFRGWNYIILHVIYGMVWAKRGPSALPESQTQTFFLAFLGNAWSPVLVLWYPPPIFSPSSSHLSLCQNQEDGCRDCIL